MKQQKGKWQKNIAFIHAAEKLLSAHPLFSQLLSTIGGVVFIEENKIPNNCWCQIQDDMKKECYSNYYQSNTNG